MIKQCLHPLVIKYIENAKVYIFYKPIKLTDKKGKVWTQIRVQRTAFLYIAGGNKLYTLSENNLTLYMWNIKMYITGA